MHWVCVTAGVTPVRILPELPLCWTWPILAGSKAGQLLSKAEPASEVNSTSVRIYLRKGKNQCTGVGKQK